MIKSKFRSFIERIQDEHADPREKQLALSKLTSKISTVLAAYCYKLTSSNYETSDKLTQRELVQETLMTFTRFVIRFDLTRYEEEEFIDVALKKSVCTILRNKWINMLRAREFRVANGGAIDYMPHENLVEKEKINKSNKHNRTDEYNKIFTGDNEKDNAYPCLFKCYYLFNCSLNGCFVH